MLAEMDDEDVEELAEAILTTLVDASRAAAVSLDKGVKNVVTPFSWCTLTPKEEEWTVALQQAVQAEGCAELVHAFAKGFSTFEFAQYAIVSKVRKTPSLPRSWANFSLLQLYSYRNARANLHILG
jgi:hypothetical protein